ncbi:transmembrane protein 177 [Ambystoma mexicanum]|uniref:transmembrane protein 177 n=1 Tax=Ambystoma mexicanum TaxID=8296 RepID=UPI0037E900E9
MANAFMWRLHVFIQRHRGSLLAASCAGVFAVNMSYHAFPKQTFKAVYQSWSKGEPVELSAKLHSDFQEVLEDVGVESLKKYSPFAAFGFDPVSAGVPCLPSGSLIGIPANFSNQDDDRQDPGTQLVMPNGKVIEWDSNNGTSLRETLQLSEVAKKFALAREIVYTKDNSPIIHAAVAPGCLLGTCLSGVAIKQLLGLYSGPVLLRGLCNLAIVTVGLVGYFFTYDAVNQWLDYRADRTAATISKDYAKGGVEFYNKLLLRNRTLRHLMGKQGEEMYAPSGNLFPTYWFRLKYTTYTSRRDIVVNIVNNQV